MMGVTNGLLLVCLPITLLLWESVSGQSLGGEAHCGFDRRPAFIKLKTKYVLGGAEVAIPNSDLADCAKLCAVNAASISQPFDCVAFDYMDASKRCLLSSRLGDPTLHRGEIEDNQVKEQLMTDEGRQSGFYWKLCMKDSSSFAANMNSTFAFEQVQNQVLLSSTEEVFKAESLQECLETCLEARFILGFTCSSSMFYYETSDCLLNSADRSSGLSSLSNDTDGFQVDYFENHFAGSDCRPGTIPQYLRVIDNSMKFHSDYNYRPVTMETCQYLCTTNKLQDGKTYSCKAFTYVPSKQTCYLVSGDGYDGGEHEMVDAMHYYEKSCFSALQTCIQTPAFEKIPHHVFIGFAQVVLDGVQEEQICLNECLRAVVNMGFECLSAMYYIDTAECILNFETAQGLEDYFTNKTTDFNVNYYDNMCAIRAKKFGERRSACAKGTSSTFVRYNNTELGAVDVLTYTGFNLQECLHKCDASENFTCRSVNFHAAEESCSLSHMNIRSSATFSTKNTDYLEKHCVENAQFMCGKLDVSYSVEKSIQLYGKQKINITGLSIDECLSLCLQDPSKDCRSVNYIVSSHICQLNNATLSSPGVEAVQNVHSIYYENHCFGRAEPQLSGVFETPQPTGGGRRHPTNLAQTTGIDLNTNCTYGFMRVAMTAQDKFTGYVFAKNKFDTCRANISDTTTGMLQLNFPSPNGDFCGVREVSRSVYSAIVIVQQNGIGIPGLVTQDDRFYNITCDYTSAVQSKITAMGPSLNVSNPVNVPQLNPEGQIYLPSPVVMELKKDGSLVKTAAIGDILTLNWRYLEGFNRTAMGVFIRNCNASRHYGQGTEPPPLPLIMDGCPTPAVQQSMIITGPITQTAEGFSTPFTAFRFDGARSVKLMCQIDFCEGGTCNPTMCDIGGQNVPSYGRKKRAVLEKSKSKHSVLKKETSFVIFSIVDKHSTKHHPQPEYFNTNPDAKILRNFHSQGVDGNSETYHSTVSVEPSRRQVCMSRTRFTVMFALVGILVITLLAVIMGVTLKQYLGEGKKLN